MATRSSRVSKRFLKEAQTLEKSTFTSSSYGLRCPNGHEVAAKLDFNEDSDASLVTTDKEEELLIGGVVLAFMTCRNQVYPKCNDRGNAQEFLEYMTDIKNGIHTEGVQRSG